MPPSRAERIADPSHQVLPFPQLVLESPQFPFRPATSSFRSPCPSLPFFVAARAGPKRPESRAEPNRSRSSVKTSEPQTSRRARVERLAASVDARAASFEKHNVAPLAVELPDLLSNADLPAEEIRDQ